MDSHIGYIMTLSNSIIGVSILAMPFCFKQCGIVLAIVMLIASSIISRLTCHFLLKSAIMARRRTFELLAFHTFGTTGKFVVELGIIGFLMGTCIAFFVIIGDLGPAIIAKMMGSKPTDTLRTSILFGVALFCVLPLGLLKNVDSLGSVSTVTIGFYFCLVLKTFSESAVHLASGDWLSKVEMWRPIGILQCLPIFAMALSCQTQLFEIYETLPNPSLDKMNYIVRIAVNICVAVYVSVGFFGYVAFATQPFTGNVLMSFSQSKMTDLMKMGFVLSVAFSFPLVIFPCRASLHSLLFKRGYTPYEGANNHIPESKFKFLTVLIIAVSLIIGIIIPNIEVVLGLVGSTIGTMICVIFPVTCFICISTKNTNERLVAQFLLFVGVIVMVLGTYANLYAMEEINTQPLVTEKSHVLLKPDKIGDIFKIEDAFLKVDKEIKRTENKKDEIKKLYERKIPLAVKQKAEEIRLEPPQPVEPQDENVKTILPREIKLKKKLEFVEQQTANPNKKTVDKQAEKIAENVAKKNEEVDIEAIKKEEKELQEEETDKQKNDEKIKETELLKTLEGHKREQEELLKEQKKILKEIKEEQEELKEKQQKDIEAENEARRKAASQIIEIAKKAIEKLAPENVGQENFVLKNKKDNKETVHDKETVKPFDPIAEKLLKMSNKTINRTKTISSNNIKNDKVMPLPMTINKTLAEIYNNKNIKKESEINIPQVSKTENEENNVIDKNSLPIAQTNNKQKEDNVFQSEQHKLQESVEIEKLEKNAAKEQQNSLNDIPEIKENKNVKEIKENSQNENKIDENLKPGKRDILANNDSTDNLIREKRESDFQTEDTILKNTVDNNDKCELKDKKYIDKTESPLIKLVSEISKSDIFKFDSNPVIGDLKAALKTKTILRRK